MTTRLPGISEDALMLFATIVAVSAVTVALVAYVGTWLAARREQRKAAADAERLPPSLDPGLPAGRSVNGRGPERVGALPD